MIPTFKGEEILSEEKLFEDYIAWQLDPNNHDQRKYPQGVPYTKENTKHWLSYLARNLSADSLTTVFLIENMQPYWLKPGKERWGFRFTFGLIGAVLYGIYGLCFGLFLWLGDLRRDLSLSELLIKGMFLGVIGGLIVGLIYGLIIWNFKEYKIKAEAFDFNWQGFKKGLIKGMINGLTFGVLGLPGGIIAGFIYINIFFKMPLKSGTMSNQFIINTLIYFMILGLILGLIGGGFNGLISELNVELRSREKSNQGIKESFKKTLIIFLISSLFFISLPSLILLTRVEIFGGIEGIEFVIWGLFLGLTVSLTSGGIDLIQHLVLRLMLWLGRKIPWDYAQFLDYATERKLLQKTGGHYRFFHDSLREYFCGNTPLSSDIVEIKNK